jgi:uroporphyrinogen decarboxylase
MEDIVSTGVDGVSIDERSSLKKMFETSRGRTVVIGNIAPMLFATGTKEDIEAAVKEGMDSAAGESGYILSSGCAIPPHTPLENMKYFMEAAEKYGRYA